MQLTQAHILHNYEVGMYVSKDVGKHSLLGF